MFPLLIPLGIEILELATASYSAWKVGKVVKNVLSVSKTAKLGKYARTSKNISKYSKRAKPSFADSALTVGGGLAVLGSYEETSVQALNSVQSSYAEARRNSSPISDPNADISFPEYTGETLIDALKHSSDTHSISNERIVNSMNLQSQMLSEIGTAVQTGTLVFSTVLPQIYSALIGISASIELSSQKPAEPIDFTPVLADISQAIFSLSSALMPQERKDFYDKHNAIADYKMTPASHTDMFGNDEVVMSPLDIQTKKNLGDGVATSLENETTVDDIDFSDLLPDLDLSNLSADVSKLFAFNGVYDSLQQLIAHMGDDGLGFQSPNLKDGING